FGQAVPGVTLGAAVTVGHATLPAASVTSDAQGDALLVLTLDTVAGASTVQLSTPRLPNLPALIHATGVAGPATALSRISGDAQGAIVGTTLPIPLSVHATD